MDELTSTAEMTEERISEVEDRSVQCVQSEQENIN